MKKLLFSMMLVAIVGVATAQNYSDKAIREAKRAERQQVYEAKLLQALKSQNFTFTANSMQANIGGFMNVPFAHNYFEVYPNFVDVNLPYLTAFAVVATPYIYNFTANQYTYTLYDNGEYWVVSVKIDSAINNQSPSITQSGTYNIHFQIYKKTGVTTLTITPSMSAAMTYQGFVTLN